MGSRKETSLAICVVTYRRPKQLARLLDSLRKLNPLEQTHTRLVVVDNDPEESARSAVNEFATISPFAVSYHVESRPGIVAARNTAIRESGQVDFIGFIDDDDEAEHNWLGELLRVQRLYKADFVAGPTCPRFEVSPPAWILRGQFFHPRANPTGTKVPSAATSNLLLRAGLKKEIGELFDERFGKSGGSDQFLTMKAVRLGYSIVWADAARVWEWIPPSRTKLSWLVRRTLRTSNTRVRAEMIIGTHSSIHHIRQAIFWLAIGPVMVLRGLILGRPHIAVRGLRTCSRGLGALAAVWGIEVRDYQRPDQSRLQ